VRLRVLKVNTAAQRFYVEHGFRVESETPERVFMTHAG
jgi:ribosomal protein S18 acetylase RimI-like enzyme